MIFDLTDELVFDDTIQSYQLQSHEAYTSRYDNSDQIRIKLPEDLCTLPGESVILIEGRLVKTDATNKVVPATDTKFVNNGFTFLFSEIRYEVNTKYIDGNVKPGITTTMKNLLSLNMSESLKLKNSGYYPNEGKIDLVDGNFQASIPLKTLLGWAETYNRVMLNVQQELILIRSNTDDNALICTTNEKAKVEINKLVWMVPHIGPGLKEEVHLTKLIEQDKTIQVPYRKWELYSQPLFPNITKYAWPVKPFTALETPRFIIIGFQTDREGDLSKNTSHFDSCDLSEIRVFINNERFPYANLNVAFKNRILLYFMKCLLHLEQVIITYNLMKHTLVQNNLQIIIH